MKISLLQLTLLSAIGHFFRISYKTALWPADFKVNLLFDLCRYLESI